MMFYVIWCTFADNYKGYLCAGNMEKEYKLFIIQLFTNIVAIQIWWKNMQTYPSSVHNTKGTYNIDFFF